MMRKRMLVGGILLFFLTGIPTIYANERFVVANEQQQKIQVTGEVTDSNGEPLPGVNVLVKGTSIGTATNANGKYQLNVARGATLVITYVGYVRQEVKVTKSVINITLLEDSKELDEVVVTGVARGTSKAKLPFTVDKISDTALKEVTGSNVAATLAGKLPGIKVLPTTGNPMDEPIIQLRGATSFASTDQPLIIVDGIVTQGVLKDINMEDVENIEVIKGAAAASFYGSKAAAGVIQIITKRGKGLDLGKVNVVFKSELGANWLGFKPERTTAHGMKVDENGDPTTTMEDDQIWDNKYRKVHDSYDFFQTRFFTSNTLSVAGNSKKGDINYYSSIQYTHNPGVVKLLKGVKRVSFRANFDARLSDKVTLSSSNLYVRTINDRRSVNFDDIYYSDPDADFYGKNLDGSDYIINPNTVSTRNNINPLYDIANKRQEGTANRYLGNYGIKYAPFEWLNLNAQYSIDFFHYYDFDLIPKGRLTVESPDGTTRSEGSVYTGTGDSFKHNAELSAVFNKQFGDFNTTLRLQYLYEDEKNEGMYGSGSKLAVSGMDIISLEQADPETRDHSSWGSRIVSNSYTAVFNGDYKEQYMLDALIRRDGSSVIGDANMWKTYFRLSGAWNIAKTFNIPHVQMLKPRISYGTAGILPAYGAKYETFSLSDGVVYGGSQLGNKNLKSALSQELEVGLDARFYDRFELGLTFSRKRNTNLPYSMTVSGVTGFSYQNVNIGEFFDNSYEASFKADIIKKKNFLWNATLTWDKLDQFVGELGRPDFTIGFLHINSNTHYGKLYATKLATSLDQVKTSKEIKPGQSVEDVFTINNYGYVVRKAYIGTVNENHMYVLDKNGASAQLYRGNMNPDWNMNWINTVIWKNLTFYFTMSYQHGGLLYNNTKLYMAFAGRNAEYWDMSGRDWSERKPMAYVNQYPRWNFIEDATFLKLRELAVNYHFTKDQLHKIGINFLSGIKVGLIGRNLLTLTNYSGPDPETRTVESGVLNGSDTPKYPSDIRTFTGTISVEF
jgi:TonB-linked SusC/RagA family outer membrane protein